MPRFEYTMSGHHPLASHILIPSFAGLTGSRNHPRHFFAQGNLYGANEYFLIQGYGVAFSTLLGAPRTNINIADFRTKAFASAFYSIGMNAVIVNARNPLIFHYLSY